MLTPASFFRICVLRSPIKNMIWIFLRQLETSFCSLAFPYSVDQLRFLLAARYNKRSTPARKNCIKSKMSLLARSSSSLLRRSCAKKASQWPPSSSWILSGSGGKNSNDSSTASYTTHASLPEEHRMIYETCRKFADEELAPNASEWDKKHTFPLKAVTKLVSRGQSPLDITGCVLCRSTMCSVLYVWSVLKQS